MKNVNKDTRNKNSKKRKIAIIVGAVVLAVAIGAVVAIVLINKNDNGGRPECPAGEKPACGILPGGEMSCRCIDENDPVPVAKPMIYLYPEKTEEVLVKLGRPERLTAVYPKYNEGWKVVANPNGILKDMNGREYYGLYWEGNGFYEETDEGFVVRGDEVAEFLEEKLAILGLNEREAEEFIVYWLPKMNKNEYNYVRFATMAEIDEDMPLAVMPKPDTVIRIMMVAKKLEQPKHLKEQKLTSVERRGFTVIEWGGADLGL